MKKILFLVLISFQVFADSYYNCRSATNYTDSIRLSVETGGNLILHLFQNDNSCIFTQNKSSPKKGFEVYDSESECLKYKGRPAPKNPPSVEKIYLPENRSTDFMVFLDVTSRFGPGRVFTTTFRCEVPSR